MSGFTWGLLVGALISPFAWEGVRWCLRKFKELTNK
jgi:hypothetical protein